MKSIWKFGLTITDLQEITLPIERILSVGVQNGELFLWAIVDPKIPERRVKIEVVGTGNPMGELLKGVRRDFIGTVQQHQFVWHVFELVDVIP